MDTLDDRLTVAIRAATRNKLLIFHDGWLQHRDHETFQVWDWPEDREVGFSCKCMGVIREWRVDARSMAERLPEARAAFRRFCRGGKKSGRDQRAYKRSRALLHRFLTKEQRWDLRANGSFSVVDGEGRHYRVGGHKGVQVLKDGEPRYSLCVAPMGNLPNYDVMLAQKLFLESSLRDLMRESIVTDLASKVTYSTGSFILEGVEPREQPLPPRVVPEEEILHDLPDDVLDNPGPWVREVLVL